MQKEVKHVGYQLTNDILGPQPKKIEAMDQLMAPASSKQLRRFFGMIYFYCDVFKQRSYILSPLNDLATVTVKKKNSKKKQIIFHMQQKQKHIDAFNEAKETIKTESK